jgi:hypothetical protein
MKIKLARTDGVPKTVTAEKVGAFGIHVNDAAIFKFEKWSLTHIPTGCCATRTETRAQARRIAQALIDTGFDWDAC